jgi:RAB protein geranylgeranyltransferase component A
VRKVKKILKENPQLKTHQIRISDALRYTFEVKDEPKGNYVKVVSKVLKRLELEGNKVIQVKNYWPKGDNYSGVNTILETASKLQWELQFHTPDSFKEQKRSHALYEKLRGVNTSLTEKQNVFKTMTAPWDQIAIPQGVLEERNLHLKEIIRKYSEPVK